MELPEELKLFDLFDFDEDSFETIDKHWNNGFSRDAKTHWKFRGMWHHKEKTRRRNQFLFNATPEGENGIDNTIFEFWLHTNWRERKNK